MAAVAATPMRWPERRESKIPFHKLKLDDTEAAAAAADSRDPTENGDIKNSATSKGERRQEEGKDDGGGDDEEATNDLLLPIQHHSRPATPDDVVFERDVLALPGGKTEKELDKHYTLAAQDLGLLNAKQSNKYGSRVDTTGHGHGHGQGHGHGHGHARGHGHSHGQKHGQNPNASDTTLTVASSLRDSFSRTSRSSPPTSLDSTSERHPRLSSIYHNSSSGGADASADASSSFAPSFAPSANRSSVSRPPSVMSHKSIASSIRSGFRKLSSLSRRNSVKVDNLTFSSESSPAVHNSVFTPSQSRRPSTGRSTVVPMSPRSIRASTYGAPSVNTLGEEQEEDAHERAVPSLSGSPQGHRVPRPLSRNQSLPSIASVSSMGRTNKNFSTPFAIPRAKSIDPRSQRSHRHLAPTHEEGYSESNQQAAAQARTARNRDLQRLRAGQLQEQRRFLSFQQEQYRCVLVKHSDRSRAQRKEWDAKERELMQRHAEQEAELEQRQLNAEMDMIRTMEAEKKTVDARLRHMEGYVKGRGVLDSSSIGTAMSMDDVTSSDGSLTPVSDASGQIGLNGTGIDSSGNIRDSGLHLTAAVTTSQKLQPPRIVSSHSMAMLNQQYRVRSQLPQLQASRINVLREQQAARMARLQARQAVEVNSLQQDAEDARIEVADRLRDEEYELRGAFAKRRDRMEWRWKVAETMERRRLEDERGVPFAELQPLDWSADAWRGEE